jgi:hypothetical protein
MKNQLVKRPNTIANKQNNTTGKVIQNNTQ